MERNDFSLVNLPAANAEAEAGAADTARAQMADTGVHRQMQLCMEALGN